MIDSTADGGVDGGVAKLSFQIRFDSGSRIVRAVFFNAVTIEEKFSSVRQVAEKFGHMHPLLLVVDVRQAKLLLSVQERVQFGEFAATLQGLSHARIAVLHALDHNENMIIDSAAQAKGLQVAEFVTEAAALEWLGADVHA